jgi:hypothetical protein
MEWNHYRPRHALRYYSDCLWNRLVVSKKGYLALYRFGSEFVLSDWEKLLGV